MKAKARKKNSKSSSRKNCFLSYGCLLRIKGLLWLMMMMICWERDEKLQLSPFGTTSCLHTCEKGLHCGKAAYMDFPFFNIFVYIMMNIYGVYLLAYVSFRQMLLYTNTQKNYVSFDYVVDIDMNLIYGKNVFEALQLQDISWYWTMIFFIRGNTHSKSRISTKSFQRIRHKAC